MTTKPCKTCKFTMKTEKKVHVVTNKREYIDVVNSGCLFLPELEEMKSCIYRVEAPKRWVGTVEAPKSCASGAV